MTSQPGYRAIRATVLERDGHICQLALLVCTRRATTVDHITPASRGGENTIENLVASCAECNRFKSDNRRPHGI